MQRNWLRTNDTDIPAEWSEEDIERMVRETDIRDLWDEDDVWRNTPSSVYWD